MQTLKQHSGQIWTYEGETVQWHGMPYSTRMTIVELADRKLWVHSPSKITDPLLCDIATLGEPTYLVSPNKLHHIYLKEWQERFPRARLYAPPGLAQKRKDLCFNKELTDAPEPQWAKELGQLVFRGSLAMEEVVFFHISSRTLILTDLVENFTPEHFRGLKKLIAKASGIVSPNGRTPLDWRISFTFRKNSAKDSLAKMLAWQPKKIIMAHGECIDKNACEFLRRSFSWL